MPSSMRGTSRPTIASVPHRVEAEDLRDAVRTRSPSASAAVARRVDAVVDRAAGSPPKIPMRMAPEARAAVCRRGLLAIVDGLTRTWLSW